MYVKLSQSNNYLLPFPQVQLSSDKLGQSVDDCDALLKKHEAFERLIATQEDKVGDNRRV